MTRSMTVAEFHDLQARTMSEDDLLADVTRIARDLAYIVYHPHRSDHSESGWPDLALVRSNPCFGPPRFLLAELKCEDDGTKKTNLSVFQKRWRDALVDAGVEWHLWRPSDLLSGRVFEVLRGEA